MSAISEISSRVKSRIESRCGFRKSSSSISRSGALKLLENTSKLEFSSFFIDYRLQLEHRGRTDESISENFEFE